MVQALVVRTQLLGDVVPCVAALPLDISSLWRLPGQMYSVRGPDCRPLTVECFVNLCGILWVWRMSDDVGPIGFCHLAVLRDAESTII